VSFAGDVPGQVLNSRQVTVAGLGPAITSFQVQYVSENTVGAPQANVATILKPVVSSSPPRLVSYGIPIDSLSYNCDPSYTLRTGSEKEVADIAVLVARGWTVVVSGFLGPDHEWVAAYVEGRGTLDGIRAAENFAPSGLGGTSTPVATMGYSGGARGAEFANELAPTYAPELNIVGAAPGGLAVNVADVLRTTDGGAFAGVDFAGTLGLDRAYPSLGISSLLNARGQQMKRDIATMCIAQFVATYATQRIESYTTNGVDPLAWVRSKPSWRRTSAATSAHQRHPRISTWQETTSSSCRPTTTSWWRSIARRA